MTEVELAKKLAQAILRKEGEGRIESFNTLICVQNYFSALSMAELLGIATQNGIEV